ncbi:hypothetical protein SAMN06297387_10750 [Streptomyces zhaozhouensis]|uniref:Uncharacterized protein n=1 Tax=Streptomyces zhaozhouensis TaxID=1300267 RepID=A0A286DVI3_9ACTN|nr:hypothetical protein [Streptomyces zhaozhouensis]SOD62677.1 hypothetical protein SAMN06297387_10750 [Streptomyces zhaozhouensis]
MRDPEIIASFGGQGEVSLTVVHHPARVVAIAHEYGYVLDDYAMTVRPTRFRMRFVRDDSEDARRRAAWADHHYRASGAWWASCWPTPPPPAGVSPEDAAAYRIAVHEQRHHPWRHPLLAFGLLLFLALVGAWALADVSMPLAVLLPVAVAGLGGWLVVWSGRKARAALSTHAATLERFERQRVYPAHGLPGER